MYAQQVYHGAPPAHNYAYAPGCVFRRTAPRTVQPTQAGRHAPTAVYPRETPAVTPGHNQRCEGVCMCYCVFVRRSSRRKSALHTCVKPSEG